MSATASPTPEVTEETTAESIYTSPEFVILAYNVPADYTTSMLEELLDKTFPDMPDVTVLSTLPWENRTDYPRRIICQHRESYDRILATQDIWVKSDSAAQASQAITFVCGDANDIPHIPFKSDEKLLVGDQPEAE